MMGRRYPSLEYGGMSSFMGAPALEPDGDAAGLDVVVFGVPWECASLSGPFAGSEFAPSVVRRASARYGGYLPEIGVDIFDHLSIADAGDVPVSPTDVTAIFTGVEAMARRIYDAGAIPFVIGGDRMLSPQVVRALASPGSGLVGIIQLGALLDGAGAAGNGPVPAQCPPQRIGDLEGVRKGSMVHIGVRGPENSRSQMDYILGTGAKVYTISEVRAAGLDSVLERAIKVAHSGTDKVYVTVSSDVLEAAHNPGGPPRFDGLTPSELFQALRVCAAAGIDGLDFVDIYTEHDPTRRSAHLAAWALIHALAGLAMARQRP